LAPVSDCDASVVEVSLVAVSSPPSEQATAVIDRARKRPAAPFHMRLRCTLVPSLWVVMS
jgi:hypothetical protein